MFNIYRNSIIMGLVDTEPTTEQLEELWCDSYELYEELGESEESKKSRIKESLISSSNISNIDLEWVIFSDIEIGDIIQARVFGGNPHAESALQAKTSAYLLSALSWDPNTQLLEEITAKRSQINEIRNKFNLNTL